MKAYIVYRRQEAEKNKAFIALFTEAGREFGIDFFYVPYDEYRQRELPDFVLNRTRDAEVSRWYEERMVRVFHSSRITELGNHKGKTLTYLQEHLPEEILQGKWAPDTAFIPKEWFAHCQDAIAAGEMSEAEKNLPSLCSSLPELSLGQQKERPLVIKSVDGHGGSEVIEISPQIRSEWMHMSQDNREKLSKEIERLSGKDCILQEMILSDSRDVRVYILGNQIYEAVLREGQGDFRSNYSLGGKAERYVLSDKEKDFVQAFLQAFEGEVLGLAGLDFIVARDGSLVFNELEEMVGSRMLYQNTDRDIVRDYVAWLKNFL